MTKTIVVDDDQTNVGLIKMLLELEGFSVISCTDMAQAVAAADSDDRVAVRFERHEDVWLPLFAPIDEPDDEREEWPTPEVAKAPARV